MSFYNDGLLQTLKALTAQVASLTTDVNAIKAHPTSEQPQHYSENYEANAVSHHATIKLQAALTKPVPEAGPKQLFSTACTKLLSTTSVSKYADWHKTALEITSQRSRPIHKATSASIKQLARRAPT